MVGTASHDQTTGPLYSLHALRCAQWAVVRSEPQCISNLWPVYMPWHILQNGRRNVNPLN